MINQTVKLIAVTQPNFLHPNSDRTVSPDEFIAYVARVSNPTNQLNTESAPRLISYLIRNEHWSPFEMVSVCMEIQTTRDIGRQILRHRSFSFQEFSQRYAAVNSMYSDREARLQDTKNRQNSISTEDEKLKNWFKFAQDDLVEHATILYKEALNRGIAKEQARALLPEGLTMSTMYMSGSLRSWLHYIKLRQANGTQAEHRDIALKAKEEILKEFPSCSDYLNGE
jgi:thymidylate synthase (FAD)